MFKILRNILVVFFLNFRITEAGGRDFYKILKIASTSSAKEIKRAFRKLSLKYHPDKCTEAKCKEKFTDVNAAYDCLGDPKKRKVYDSVGRDEDNFKTRYTQLYSGQSRSDETPKGSDTRQAIHFDLTTLYIGTTIEIRYFRDALCQRIDECEKNDEGCARAGVRKSTRRIGGIFVQQIEEVDTSCVSEGKRYLKNCKACPNGSTVEDEISVSVDILPGMKHDQELIFEEYADEKMGHIPGNLIVTVKEKPHEYFVRDGDDLKLSLGIDLDDALVGFKRTIKHVDGHDVVVSSDEVIDCPYVKVIKEEGMPKESGGFGNLIVTFEIRFPSKRFTNKEKQLLRNVLKD